MCRMVFWCCRSLLTRLPHTTCSPACNAFPCPCLCPCPCSCPSPSSSTLTSRYNNCSTTHPLPLQHHNTAHDLLIHTHPRPDTHPTTHARKHHHRHKHRYPAHVGGALSAADVASCAVPCVPRLDTPHHTTCAARCT
ncbi:uncharacterized protein K452DRAFT_64799 [Aplosporella prunicola CBS 121167]|uniref:Secreted protein n=1 Tax=Aplosporella prunicola CBS 121167 TaxID=1176127 RepID=A0A6A6B6H6_9PEZI|nr:uncharacterized protein K452DRAFT_64799 [Aplosporella prunicola CBS 121167]KAF2139732.1 hypothetical protein K452DRAFT_64799 [Aplosporella prunicola CBS 121167]